MTIGESRRPTGQGFSAVTVMLTAEVERDGTAIDERYVLRMETPEPPIYPPQSDAHPVEIDIQRRVMEALAGHSRVPGGAGDRPRGRPVGPRRARSS